jgi:competence protein ComEA
MAVVARTTVVCVAVGAASFALLAQGPLPEGKGKSTVQMACATACHGPEMVARQARTPTEWQAVIDRMIASGARISDSDYDIILEYLSEHLLATVNVNTAAARRIQDVLEISERDARAIVECRDKQGRFKRWEDVAAVPGVDSKVIEQRKARLIFEDKETKPGA